MTGLGLAPSLSSGTSALAGLSKREEVSVSVSLSGWRGG